MFLFLQKIKKTKGEEYSFFANDHSPSKPIQWKKGLPSDIELHIKKIIAENRKEKPEDVFLFTEYVKNPEVCNELLEFEIGDPLKTKCFSIGVLYSKAGQTTESEMFNNGKREKKNQISSLFIIFFFKKMEVENLMNFYNFLEIKFL